ncbi:FCD domain-containing protein [Streptomyces sp. NPDC002405]
MRGMTADLQARVEAFVTRDVEAFVAADVAFHLKVAVTTHNPVLSDLYGSLVSTLAEAMRRGSCLETEEAAGGSAGELIGHAAGLVGEADAGEERAGPAPLPRCGAFPPLVSVRGRGCVRRSSRCRRRRR